MGFIKNKRILITLLLLSIIGLFSFFLSQEYVDKQSLKKEELFKTKELSYDQLYQIERNQRSLYEEIKSQKNRDWLAREIQEGTVKVRFTLDFMADHQEYDLFEINFPITKYVGDDTVIEYISGEGQIIKVHSSKNGWEEYKKQ